MRRLIHGAAGFLGSLKRALYRGDRPNLLMRAANRFDAVLYGSGFLTPRQAATLTVVGRRSGRAISVPVAVTEHDGERFLVSMLGSKANWVRNVRAAGGHAVLRQRGHEVDITLDDVPVEHRAPIIRSYLAIAPGARPHIRVDRGAPLEDFEA